MNANTNSMKAMRPGGSGRSAAAPIYAIAALTLGFIWIPGFMDVSYEHRGVLLFLYALLVTGVSAWAAALAYRGYMASGLAEMLYAGCGLMAMGSSFLLAAWVIGSPEGRNDAVTVHGLGVLCGSLFHLAAALHAGQPGVPGSKPSAGKALSAYLGVLVLVGGFWAAAAHNLTPGFYLQETGTTPIRALAVLASVALLSAAATLLIRSPKRPLYPSFRYYGLGLALISLGLVDGFTSVPGSVLGWTGRISQSLGHLYILAAFMTAIRTALRKGMDVQEAAAEYYLYSEDHYRTLVNALRAAVISIDPRERVVLWNPTAEAIFGCSHAEVAVKPLPELFTAEGAERETLRKALKERPERYLEMTLRRKDGVEFPADVMAIAAGGGWKQWTNLIIRDTTDRKQAEQALRRYELLSAHSRDIILYMRRDDGRILEANDSAVAAYGYSREELLNLCIQDLRAPNTRGLTEAQMAEADLMGILFETVHRRKDGSTFPVEISSRGAAVDGVRTLISVIRDITARKQAELALVESEERLRLAHAAAALGMWIHDVDADTIVLDALAQEHYGSGPSQTLAEIVARVHPDDRALLSAKIRTALDPAAAEDHVAAEYRVVGAGGAERWLSIAGRVTFEGEGASRRALRAYGTSQDITDRKTAEQALRASEDALRQTNERLEEIVRQRTAQLEDTVAALKNEVVVRRKIQTQLHQLSRVFMDAADPITIEDLSGTIIDMNREAESVYGWSRDELIGKPMATLFLPERHHLAEQLRERCRRGEEIRYWEGVRRARSGRIIPSILTAFPLMDESGKIAFVATISKDISVRKEMEARLIDSQRHLQDLSRKSLEALETDRRTVSRELHDSIGGSLAAIKFGLEDAAEQADRDPACRVTSLPTIISHLADTIKETKRISANLRPLTLDDLGLLATIESYCRQFSQRYGAIHLVREIEAGEQEIPDEFKIVVYRVMQEALTNAAKHSNADTVHIRLRREDAQVVFEVEDNGCGFSANEVLNRDDCMSGFGLKSMQERTEICDGVFTVRSTPGAGTSIRVTLRVGGPEAALKDTA
ncbi:MAG: PAS domain S-box protein [Hyphomicrobiales bacterium]